MVCASSLPSAIPTTGPMSWVDWRGPLDWSSKDHPPASDAAACSTTSQSEEAVQSTQSSSAAAEVAEEAEALKAPTPAKKQLWRLQKKLREISKLEERAAGGEGLDLLQQKKIEKKAELIAQARQAEDEVAEEERQQLLCAASPAALPAAAAAASPAAAAAAALAPAPAPAPLMPLVLVMQPGEPQHLCPWQAFTLQGGAAVPQLAVPDQAAQLQSPAWAKASLLAPRAWADASAEQGGQQIPSSEQSAHHQAWADTMDQEDSQEAELAPSVSALRRSRRQRQARRRPLMSDSRATAPAATPTHEVMQQAGSEEALAAMAEDLQAGGEARDAALTQFHGQVAIWAFDRQGCRAVQLALEMAGHAAAAELLAELHGLVGQACASPHANYVLQTAITALPTTASGFVVRELLGMGTRVARHRFGCRILCRLIEHAGAEGGDFTKLMEELIAEAKELSRHTFGHYVVQTMLEHLPKYRQRVAEALLGDFTAVAQHRCGSHVVEAVLGHGSDELREVLARKLLGGGLESVASLGSSQYGSFVLKTLLRTPGRHQDAAWEQLHQVMPSLERCKYGQRLLKDMQLSSAAMA